jgi:hypothetical protein
MFSKKVTSIFSIDFAISHLARAEQGAPERIRTTNLLIRSQQICPREFELQMQITRGERIPIGDVLAATQLVFGSIAGILKANLNEMLTIGAD